MSHAQVSGQEPELKESIHHVPHRGPECKVEAQMQQAELAFQAISLSLELSRSIRIPAKGNVVTRCMNGGILGGVK
jgi:hypothetical protein